VFFVIVDVIVFFLDCYGILDVFVIVEGLGRSRDDFPRLFALSHLEKFINIS